MTMRLLLHEAAEALFPQRCVACNRFGAALHSECLPTLPAAEAPRCLRCWRPGSAALCTRCIAEPPAFEALRTPYRFDGIARRAILEAKFLGVTALLSPLAESAARLVPPAWAIDAVVPVPLHSARERRRGYNQAAMLASVVAEHISVPLERSWLRKVRATQPQAGLDAVTRAKNLTFAFAASGIRAGACVLLIDDVTTTGTTFQACARTVLDAGAEHVYALAVARED